MDKRVESIKQIDLSGLRIPLIAVHVSPIDYPGKIMARIFDLDKPTDTVVVRDTIGEIMEDIRSNTNMMFVLRGTEDIASLVGVWM